MIYFDNAATTMNKPRGVLSAVAEAMRCSANPGRSGHKPALKAAQTVFECRVKVAELFRLDAPDRVVFTCNATHALNVAIKSLMRGGGHAVVSGYEHNSVIRPLNALSDAGVTYTVAASELFDPNEAFEKITAAITPQTRCVIMTHMSNVFGFVLPLEQIDKVCAQKGIPLIVDASQSAGILDIDARQLKSVHFICMPGHKSLYGPQGTGLLLCCKDDQLYSLLEGGTGSDSLNERQPAFLPDVFESGTLNVPAIAGLMQGVAFVMRNGVPALREHKRELVRAAAEGLGNIIGVTPYAAREAHEGLISFTAPVPSEVVCQALAERDICLRGGLHCAPHAHRSAGTLPDGTARVSFSCFNTRGEVEMLLRTVNELSKKWRT